MRFMVLVVALAGCTINFVDNPEPDPAPELTAAQRAWVDQALPIFRSQCMTCHVSSGGAIDFFAGNTVWEIRDNVLASGVVNLDDPASSRLLTKGLHSGPGMSAQTASAILEWLVAERDER